MTAYELRAFTRQVSKVTGRKYALWCLSDGWHLFRFARTSFLRDRPFGAAAMSATECEAFLAGVLEGYRDRP
jgi:hypothetical protein